MHLPGGKKTVLVALGLVAALIVGYRLFLYRPSVPVVAVKQAEVQGRVKGPGTVQSKVPVTVSAKITGIIEKLYADQGDRGTKGQLLAELDAAELKAKVASSRAARHRAQRELSRVQADAAKARANLELAQTRLDYAVLRAPVSGVVLTRPAEPGEVAAVGATILTTADLDNVYVEVYVPQTDLGRLRLGQRAWVSIDAYPQREFPGWISFINAKAEFTPKTVETYKERVALVYRTKIRVDNPEHLLKPGMPAEVVIRFQDDGAASSHSR